MFEKVCNNSCCSCWDVTHGWGLGSLVLPESLQSQDNPYCGKPTSKASKAPAVKWLPIQVASVILQAASPTASIAVVISESLLLFLYFSSEMDASVRQFVFLGKCKKRWWWHGDAFRLGSILPPTPWAAQRTASRRSVPFLPTLASLASGLQQWGRTDCPHSCCYGARFLRSSWYLPCFANLRMVCQPCFAVHAAIGGWSRHSSVPISLLFLGICVRLVCASGWAWGEQALSLCFLVEKDSVFRNWKAWLDQLYNWSRGGLVLKFSYMAIFQFRRRKNTAPQSNPSYNT